MMHVVSRAHDLTSAGHTENLTRYTEGFHRWGVPKNCCFIIVENLIEMDDLGVPWGTTILGNLQVEVVGHCRVAHGLNGSHWR